MYDFAGKTVLVTGASHNIGLEIAKIFLKGKANVIITELPERYDELLETMKALESIGSKVYGYPLDVTSITSIQNMIDQLKKDNILVDILVNNVGINVYCDAVDTTEDIWDTVVDTNLKGTFFLTKEIARYSLLDRQGNVVSIASQHGVVGNIRRAPYCASKAGIINMTRALALEWACFGVRVNCVSPTFVIHEANDYILNNSTFKRNHLNKIPLRKYAEPIDVANGVAFLTGDTARMITGQNLIIDGGWVAG